MFELFIADLIKNQTEDNKDIYREKLLEQKVNKLNGINRLNIEDDEDVDEILIRRRSRASSIYSAKPIVKYLKMPQFSKTNFYRNLCIEAFSNELEVFLNVFILF